MKTAVRKVYRKLSAWALWATLLLGLGEEEGGTYWRALVCNLVWDGMGTLCRKFGRHGGGLGREDGPLGCTSLIACFPFMFALTLKVFVCVVNAVVLELAG